MSGKLTEYQTKRLLHLASKAGITLPFSVVSPNQFKLTRPDIEKITTALKNHNEPIVITRNEKKIRVHRYSGFKRQVAAGSANLSKYHQKKLRVTEPVTA